VVSKDDLGYVTGSVFTLSWSHDERTEASRRRVAQGTYKCGQARVPTDPPASSPQQASDGARLSQGDAVFVGRQAELLKLKAAFEKATAGQGTLILLVGEPGIGKTALCEQLANFTNAHGGLPLVGHCYPEGSAGMPYQPFVEVFSKASRARNATPRRSERSWGRARARSLAWRQRLEADSR
jgi:hypothetical protein